MMKKQPSRQDRSLHKEMTTNSYSMARGASQYSKQGPAVPLNLNRGPATGNARRPRRPSKI